MSNLEDIATGLVMVAIASLMLCAAAYAWVMFGLWVWRVLA